MNFFNPTPTIIIINISIIIIIIICYCCIYILNISYGIFSIHDISYVPYQFFTPSMMISSMCIILDAYHYILNARHPTQNRLPIIIMKYTTTVLALAVVAAKSVDGQRRNFRRTLNKGQMRRRELQDGSMSMLTQYKGTSGTTKATSSSSDETESCAPISVSSSNSQPRLFALLTNHSPSILILRLTHSKWCLILTMMEQP